MLYGLISPVRDARHRAENGFSAGVNGREPRPYWPLFLRTWSQAGLILDRCSLRHARMVKSPWSITGRQNFCTSRVQAFCSSAVPLRCCCECAPDESRDRQQGECQEKFTHRIPSFRQQETLFPDLRFGIAGTDLFGWQAPRNAATSSGQASANAAKFTAIYSTLLSTLNNRLIFNVYLCHTFLAIGCCRRCGA